MKTKVMVTLFSVLLITTFNAKSAVTEVQGCNLKENVSMSDVVDHSVSVNAIQDGNGYTEKRFGQLIMQPNIEQTTKSEFDFYYLNFWGSYQIYGNDMSEWSDQGKGNDFMEQLGQLIDCRSLNIFDTIVTREYPGD